MTKTNLKILGFICLIFYICLLSYGCNKDDVINLTPPKNIEKYKSEVKIIKKKKVICIFKKKKKKLDKIK
jgi:hypothetical protein